jgi:hypothetical protein
LIAYLDLMPSRVLLFVFDVQQARFQAWLKLLTVILVSLGFLRMRENLRALHVPQAPFPMQLGVRTAPSVRRERTRAIPAVLHVKVVSKASTNLCPDNGSHVNPAHMERTQTKTVHHIVKIVLLDMILGTWD